MLYFFAALIVSIEHFIFFQFIAPPDFLNNTMTQAIVALKNADFNSEVIEPSAGPTSLPSTWLSRVFSIIYFTESYYPYR